MGHVDRSENPDDFAKEEIDPENMNYVELKTYIEKVKRSGGGVEQYLTDLYFKFSYPLAGAIFVLLGIALSSAKRKQSIATGFGTMFTGRSFFLIWKKRSLTIRSFSGCARSATLHL